jgi:hypothetical protein
MVIQTPVAKEKKGEVFEILHRIDAPKVNQRWLFKALNEGC